MSEENLYGIDQSFKNISNFTVVERDGEYKVKPPKAIMPTCAKERIFFVRKCIDNGLSFLGGLNMVLAYDEEESRKDFIIGWLPGDWIPVTEEFKQWRDEPCVFREAEIAVALLYGTCIGVTE